MATDKGANRSSAITSHTIVQLQTDDYIEIFVTNKTNTNNVVVEDLNVIVEPES